jgi:pathogenesis-related protein 1
MQQSRVGFCVLVGLAFSLACSGTDEGPALESGGIGSTSAGGPSANGGDSSASGGNSSAGSSVGGGGRASSAGNSSTGGSSNGGASNAGGAIGGGGASGAGAAASGGKSSGGSGGVSGGGAGSGGKSAGGAGGAGSGGKSAGGAGGAGSGGKGGSGGSGGSGACPEVNAQLCGMTAQHNQARANVNPVPATPLPAMSWNTTVAAAAQAWADQCNFSHNTSGYGQNLYASAGGGPPSPAAAVTSWVSEVSAYNYSSNTCSGTCGHYTQVVWRSSTLLGCGFKSCSTNSPFGAQFPNWYIVVCDYSPAGNNGSRPY